MSVKRPAASIVIPAYNVALTIRRTVKSALNQQFDDFEVVVVDDGSTDETPEILSGIRDGRLRIVRQRNRGLAGARNSGIAAARGRYIGFLDGDDLWEPGKLAAHVAHLASSHQVGVSFSASRLIDLEDRWIGLTQSPQIEGIRPEALLRRNPIGNGSAPVIRRQTLDAIAWRPVGETERDWWFDETFRQSEDVECWMRIALTTHWRFEGLAEPLTLYRVNPGGLSANLERQHETWERMMERVARIAPEFAAKHGRAARAYQLRYLARRAVADRNGESAVKLMKRSFGESREPLSREPVKTISTLLAAGVLHLIGSSAFEILEQTAFTVLSRIRPAGGKKGA